MSLWNDLADPVFDGVGLAGFKSNGHAFLLALSCSIPPIVFSYFSLTLLPVYRLVLWICGAGDFGLIGCISLSLSLALPPTSFNNNNISSKQLMQCICTVLYFLYLQLEISLPMDCMQCDTRGTIFILPLLLSFRHGGQPGAVGQLRSCFCCASGSQWTVGNCAPLSGGKAAGLGQGAKQIPGHHAQET